MRNKYIKQRRRLNPQTTKRPLLIKAIVGVISFGVLIFGLKMLISPAVKSLAGFLQESRLMDGTIYKNLLFMSSITGWIVFQNIVIILIFVTVATTILKIHPALKFSWLNLFGSQATNITLIPIQIRYFGLIFTPILALSMPTYALNEEAIFRLGTENWNEAIYMSFLFGITHCIVGVPLGIGIAMTLPGLWFSYQYFQGGIELSALHHTTINLILVGMIFTYLIHSHLPSRKDSV